MNYKVLYFIISLLPTILIAESTQLTFDLPDRSKQCFYQFIAANCPASLEFQVLEGGQQDIDITMRTPDMLLMYSGTQEMTSYLSFIASITGPYEVCFSNEFSPFSHKRVYMNFDVNDAFLYSGNQEHVTTMTQMDISIQEISRNMARTVYDQKAYRLGLAISRSIAGVIDMRIIYVSTLQTALTILIPIMQVYAMKRSFLN